MENTMNEGQTQVYADGGVTPTAGIDNGAPYLNNPPQQLMDLIQVLFNQSGKTKPDGKGKILRGGPMTDAQVLAILVGMGIPQQLALSGIGKYRETQDIATESIDEGMYTADQLTNMLLDDIRKGIRKGIQAPDAKELKELALKRLKMKRVGKVDIQDTIDGWEKSLADARKDKMREKMFSFIKTTKGKIPESVDIYTENNKQKNHNKMNFTLTDLYENVMDSINKLKTMDNDNSRVSYSVKESLTILEEAIKSFPMKLKNADLSQISEEIETATNPDLKFQIARHLYTKLSQSTWLNPISELREYIMESYNNAKWQFRISESIARTSTQKGKLIESLNDDLVSLLTESDVKSKFAVIAAKNPWSTDVKAIVNEMNAEDNKVASTANGKVVNVLSPVLESENGLTFQLHGKNYTYDGKTITEANVTDQRFYDVSEGLAMFSRNANILSLHGDNDKTLTYNITEGTLSMGKIDLSNVSIIELKETLLATNFSGYKNQWQNDKICKFFESVDLVCELDNFTTIQNQEFLDVFLTMIGVQEGIYINKVNPGMGLNEMVRLDTATETVELVKEFINFDIAPILSERLIAENNEKAIVENKRKDLSDALTFLEEKKSEVEAAIKKLGETEELSEALSILEEELKGKEKELADSYISEKKSKDDYLNDGFVEASVKKKGQGLTVNQEVLVSAEEYASLGDDDLLTVMIPKSGKSVVLPKADLSVKI